MQSKSAYGQLYALYLKPQTVFSKIALKYKFTYGELST